MKLLLVFEWHKKVNQKDWKILIGFSLFFTFSFFFFFFSFLFLISFSFSEIIRLKVAVAALEKEDDVGSKERIKTSQAKLEELEKESNDLSEIWQREREVINRSKELVEKIEVLRMRAARAQVF